MNIVNSAPYSKTEAQSSKSKLTQPNQGTGKEQLSIVQDWLPMLRIMIQEELKDP